MKTSLREIFLWVFVSAVAIQTASTQYHFYEMRSQFKTLEEVHQNESVRNKNIEYLMRQLDKIRQHYESDSA